jgi:PRTRC genetic system protein B
VRTLVEASTFSGHLEAAAPHVVTLNAKTAIVLYEGFDRFAAVPDPRQAVLAARHDVIVDPGDKGGKGAPVLGAGVPLDRRELDLMLRQIAGQPEARQRQMIPPDLLYLDESRMVWHTRVRRAPIYFRTGRAEWDAQMNGAEVLWPALLFRAERGSLHAWALEGEGKERPTPQTLLYLAPMMNFYGRGAMCIGSTPIPDLISLSTRGAWEQALYDTEFTHGNHQGARFVAHPKGHDGLWREMRWRATFRGFPARYLVPAQPTSSGSRQLTVEEVIAE